MSDCSVYVIAVEGQHLSKVGISENPKKRIKQLVTGSPFRMNLAHVFRAPNRDIARALETGFHQVMRKHRTRGEWFNLSAEDAIWHMSINLYSMLTTHLEMSREEVFQCMMLSGVPEEHLEAIASLGHEQ